MCRLTTGPANGFILFSQMVTTTFTLDAYGEIPFNRITSFYSILQRAYTFLYGIFNLEPIANLLSDFCLSSHLTAIDILALQYSMASFPLVMIVVITLSLKLKDYCCSKCMQMLKFSRRASCLKRSKVSRVFLPAFSSFLLLSFHKFGLTSAYLMSSQALVYANGTYVYPKRVFFAGHIEWSHPSYLRNYFVPSIIVMILLSTLAIMLLGFPVTHMEKCLSRMKLLWRFYPADKIHVFLDTFHGCYKGKLRFFSGLYLFFRLIVNVAYILSDSFIYQFVVQQFACVTMLVLVALLQPYKDMYLNVVDALIFADLLILNTMSLLLYFLSQIGHDPPIYVFAVRYVFLLLPFVYMIGYVILALVKKFCYKSFKRVKAALSRNNGVQLLAAPLAAFGDETTNDSSRHTRSLDEELFLRAQESNHYRVINSSLEDSVTRSYNTKVTRRPSRNNKNNTVERMGQNRGHSNAEARSSKISPAAQVQQMSSYGSVNSTTSDSFVPPKEEN